MKRFVAGVVVGLVASCAIAFASTSVNHNGLFWNKLNRPVKEGYVNGYADAMRVSVSKLDTLTRPATCFIGRDRAKSFVSLKRSSRCRS